MGESIRYLGVHITSAKAFVCSLANAKKSFYRAFNAVFGKVAGVASEEVTVDLLKLKMSACAVIRSIEACPISNKHIKSLDFVLNGWTRTVIRNLRTRILRFYREMKLTNTVQNYPKIHGQTQGRSHHRP